MSLSQKFRGSESVNYSQLYFLQLTKIVISLKFVAMKVTMAEVSVTDKQVS